MSKLLHWIVALLMIGMICLGWYMVDLSYYDRWYHHSLSLHKSIGILVLMLGALDIMWQFYNGLPNFAATFKPWEKIGARVAHLTLFSLMLVIPITGYLTSTSEGRAISMFGWFDMPVVFIASEKHRDLAINVHYCFAYATALLIILHVSAALKHQFLDKDGTLRRMM